MISKQIWKPDTCKCVLEEQYDKDIKDFTITCSQIINKCEDHTDVPDEELYGVIYANPDGENKIKNLVHKTLIEHPDLNFSKRILNKDGTSTLSLKDGIEYEWSFTGKGKSRSLNVKLTGVTLTTKEREIIKTHWKDSFGEEKVNIL